MTEVAINLGAVGAYSVLMLSLFKFYLRGTVLPGIIIVVTYVGYVLLASIVLRRLWRMVAVKIRAPWLRVPLQAALFALLFSPTFLACGALAPMPFPMVLAGDLVFPGPACGENLRSFTPFNVAYVVVPTWLVFTVLYGLKQYLSRRGAL